MLDLKDQKIYVNQNRHLKVSVFLCGFLPAGQADAEKVSEQNSGAAGVYKKEISRQGMKMAVFQCM